MDGAEAYVLRSVREHAKQGGSSQSPVSWRHLRGNSDLQDEVCRHTGGRELALSARSFVERRVIVNRIGLVVLDRLEPDDRHSFEELARLGLSKSSLLTVPAGTLTEETVDVDAINRLLFNFFSIFELEDLESPVKSIDSDRVLTSVRLQHTSHEALREEHARHPVGCWVAIAEPAVEEGDTLKQVLEPGGEWLQRQI